MKFSSFFKILLVLVLVLTVGLVPTVAKASSTSVESEREDFSNNVSTVMYLQTSTYGAYSTRMSQDGVGATWGDSWINYTSLDQGDYNARFIFDVDMHANINPGVKIELTIPFTSLVVVDSTNYYFNSGNVTQTSIICEGTNGAFYTVIPTINYDISSDGQNLLSISFVAPEYVYSFEIITYFNCHNAYNVNVMGGRQTWIRLFSGTKCFLSSTKYYGITSDIYDVDFPNWNGKYDLGDLPPIEQFIPDGSNPLMVAIAKFTNLTVVVNMLIIVSVMGVLAYVVFGKRS